MTPRDAHGRFVSREEAAPEVFGAPDREAGTVSVDVGRGQLVEVDTGLPFVETVEGLARDAHYGGYYKVYLAQGNEEMHEIVNPEDGPETIEEGMRIAITSYNRGCVPTNSRKAEKLILSQVRVKTDGFHLRSTIRAMC